LFCGAFLFGNCKNRLIPVDTNKEFYEIFKADAKETLDIDIEETLPGLELKVLRKSGCCRRACFHWGSMLPRMKHLSFTFWFPLWMDVGPNIERSQKKQLVKTRASMVT